MNGAAPDPDQPPPPMVVWARPIQPAVIASPAPRWSALAPLELSELTRFDAGLDLALLLLTAVVAHYGLPLLLWLNGSLGALAPEGAAGESLGTVAALGKWMEFGLVAGIAAYLILRHGVRPSSLGLRRDGLLLQAAWSLPTLVAVYAYLIGTMVIFAALLYFAPNGDEEVRRRSEFIRSMPTTNMGTAVVLLVAVAAHEELLFRGIMLPLMRRVLGNWVWAVVATSVIFGMLHFTQGWIAMVQVTGLAFVLCAFFLWSRSLVPVVIAHFLFDFLQLQLMRVLQQFPHLLNPPA